MDLVGEYRFFLESKQHGPKTLVLYCLHDVCGVHALEVEFMTPDEGANLVVNVGALNLNLTVVGAAHMWSPKPWPVWTPRCMNILAQRLPHLKPCGGQGRF